MRLNDTRKFHADRNEDINNVLYLMQNSKMNAEATILKSAIILMLYNQIEGTISNILCELFDYIIDENIEFNLLHHKIRKLYLEYYCKRIGSSCNELENFHNKQDLKDVDYLELNKYLKLYSGNLDARKIREISQKLGVTIRNACKGEKLIVVKEKRNALAHGEVGFKEACRDVSNKDMSDIVKEIQTFLIMIIEDYERFIIRQLVIKK